ncbi:unnamed protein product [Amaranthus hypochondriacus]
MQNFTTLKFLLLLVLVNNALGSLAMFLRTLSSSNNSSSAFRFDFLVFCILAKHGLNLGSRLLDQASSHSGIGAGLLPLVLYMECNVTLSNCLLNNAPWCLFWQHKLRVKGFL